MNGSFEALHPRVKGGQFTARTSAEQEGTLAGDADDDLQRDTPESADQAQSADAPYPPVMPSWTALERLHDELGIPEPDAKIIVNDLIHEAQTGRESSVSWWVAHEYVIADGRTWQVSCRFAPFVAGSIFEFKDVTGIPARQLPYGDRAASPLSAPGPRGGDGQ